MVNTRQTRSLQRQKNTKLILLLTISSIREYPYLTLSLTYNRGFKISVKNNERYHWER